MQNLFNNLPIWLCIICVISCIVAKEEGVYLGLIFFASAVLALAI